MKILSKIKSFLFNRSELDSVNPQSKVGSLPTLAKIPPVTQLSDNSLKLKKELESEIKVDYLKDHFKFNPPQKDQGMLSSE